MTSSVELRRAPPTVLRSRRGSGSAQSVVVAAASAARPPRCWTRSRVVGVTSTVRRSRSLQPVMLRVRLRRSSGVHGTSSPCVMSRRILGERRSDCLRTDRVDACLSEFAMLDAVVTPVGDPVAVLGVRAAASDAIAHRAGSAQSIGRIRWRIASPRRASMLRALAVAVEPRDWPRARAVSLHARPSGGLGAMQPVWQPTTRSARRPQSTSVAGAGDAQSHGTGRAVDRALGTIGSGTGSLDLAQRGGLLVDARSACRCPRPAARSCRAAAASGARCSMLMPLASGPGAGGQAPRLFTDGPMHRDAHRRARPSRS